jgi:5-methylcytosine-specific restriction enzyme subunit McrC
VTVISVREFATLTMDSVKPTLDRATLTAEDFAWLAGLATNVDGAARPLRFESPRTLRVQNLVGVIRLPSGVDLEILPKHTEASDSLPATRRLLFRMIAAAHDIPARDTELANLEVLNRPFTEWMAKAFVAQVTQLLRRGLRSDYQRVEGCEPYLRGRLELARQLRAGPAALLNFQITHDVFSMDRAENRLIRTAIEKVARSTRAPETWRVARELASLLAKVPLSLDVRSDLGRWRDDRMMSHYGPVRPLCELILTGLTPFAVSGRDQALSMLFPMERLFEAFVERSVRKALPDYRVQSQPRTHSLCDYAESRWFDLRPDLVARRGEETLVIDAKWKRLHSDQKLRFNISQSDVYQLHAYGQTYLGGHGELHLVYPRTADFPKTEGPLLMKPALRLYIRSIDLETGDLSDLRDSGSPISSNNLPLPQSA